MDAKKETKQEQQPTHVAITIEAFEKLSTFLFSLPYGQVAKLLEETSTSLVYIVLTEENKAK